MRAAKSKAGRPRIPFSNISNKKPDGLTGSPSDAPAGEGEAQLAKGGAAKKRMDKKSRSGKVKRAEGGNVPVKSDEKDQTGKPVPTNVGSSEPDTMPDEKNNGGRVKSRMSKKKK